jgi:hypothetical protein
MLANLQFLHPKSFPWAVSIHSILTRRNCVWWTCQVARRKDIFPFLSLAIDIDV